MSLNVRSPEFAVDPLFINRWSPRAFTGEPISLTELFSLFEAARWAPSSNNAQPWRFVYALRESEIWPLLFGLLSESNKRWAVNASALVVLLSRTEHLRPGALEAAPLWSHSLDAGAAWANLSLQGSITGWRTRAMGGFDHEKARTVLLVPREYRIEVAIAIGRQADRSSLPLALQEKEIPSPRRPLKELVSEGRFAFPD